MSSQQTADGADACVEHGIWTPVPTPPPAALHAFTLKLKDVDPAEHDRIENAGRMTFHVVGCTGDFNNHQPQVSVGAAMAAQVDNPGSMGVADGPAATASFLFHLGDVVYKDEDAEDPNRDDQRQMYNAQFYAPYAGYDRCIFAIAGNHDGKVSRHDQKSAIHHFFTNFCAKSSGVSPDNTTDNRPAMTQPYVYWRLDTPLAYIIGLYSNIANGGILDDPSQPGGDEQYEWLVAQLKDVQTKNAHNTPRRAVLLAVHYPPYSGTTNFAQRGDPTLGPTNATTARPLGTVLQQAFRDSGQRPDAIISAHAHLYQRLTYRYNDGWEVPCVIAGSGGHSPVEDVWKQCDGTMGQPKGVPFEAVLPSGLTVPPGESAHIVAYDDQAFGFLRVTIASDQLTGEFFIADPGQLTLADSFALDLTAHVVAEVGR